VNLTRIGAGRGGVVRKASRGARALAIIAVATVIIGWGDAQWPYVLPESLTFSAAAAPSGTLTALLIVVVLAAPIVVPGFILLYILDQKSLLPEEGVDDEPASSAGLACRYPPAR
jgi:cytochrome bd ubiquinol oxidase subunit II